MAGSLGFLAFWRWDGRSIVVWRWLSTLRDIRIMASCHKLLSVMDVGSMQWSRVGGDSECRRVVMSLWDVPIIRFILLLITLPRPKESWLLVGCRWSRISSQVRVRRVLRGMVLRLRVGGDRQSRGRLMVILRGMRVMTIIRAMLLLITLGTRSWRKTPAKVSGPDGDILKWNSDSLDWVAGRRPGRRIAGWYRIVLWVED